MNRLSLRIARPALAALIALFATPAQAAPGGPLRVLLKGYWICETGGDATTAPVPQPQDSFRVLADSSYRSNDGGTGTYLLLGTDLTMTGGPFRGRRYVLVGQGIVHPLDASGKRSAGRCVRQSGAGADSVDTDPPGA
jgi:hypothetical protein